MFTVRETAARLGISPSLVYALCQAGVIRHSRHGRPGKRGTIRIPQEAIEEYIASCRVPIPPPAPTAQAASASRRSSPPPSRFVFLPPKS